VVVLATLGAPECRVLGRRRARAAPPAPPPAPVTVTRATVIGARPFRRDRDAGPWLRTADLEAEAAAALAVLNRVLHLHRTAAADPHAREVAREQALVARVGVGASEQVAEGRWEQAVELPPQRRDARRRALPPPRRGARRCGPPPAERLTALFGAHDAALACEELALRARLDADAGRDREAALQLGVALDAALSELEPWAERGDLRARLDELHALRPAADAAARDALQGGLDDAATADVKRALERLEAALLARTAAGVE
jgi:hypothetical protein